jgi:glutamyl-tRNA synthetase
VVKEPLLALREKLAGLDDWSAEVIHQAIDATAEQFELKMAKIGMPLRVAVTGGGVSPSIDVTMQLIGHERCLRGIDKALKYIEEREAS